MLTPKQEVLTRLVVAHIMACEDELTPMRTLHLKSLADYIIEYGNDRKIIVHPPETPISGLGFGKRAQACIGRLMRENGLAEGWRDAKDLEVSVVAPLVYEEVLVDMKNVGANTIREIKRGFGLCGIHMLASKPEEVEAETVADEEE